MTIEDTAKAEIEAMPPEIARGTLAQAVLDLARRLDAGPGDRTAVELAREIRVALRELRALAGKEATSDLDKFLAGVQAEAFNAGH